MPIILVVVAFVVLLQIREWWRGDDWEIRQASEAAAARQAEDDSEASYDLPPLDVPEPAILDVPEPAIVPVLTAPDRLLVCRAAIATMMGRPIDIIAADERVDLVWVSYVRPDDGTRWSDVCRFNGNRVEWAYVENGQIGRWRTHPDDEVITFRLTEREVEIVMDFGDGSTTQKSFLRE